MRFLKAVFLIAAFAVQAWALEDSEDQEVKTGGTGTKTVTGTVNTTGTATITVSGQEDAVATKEAPAGESGELSGEWETGTGSNKKRYKTTMTWVTEDGKLKITLKTEMKGGELGMASSTIYSISGTPTTGMTVVVDVSLLSVDNDSPLDDTFAYPEAVLLYDENGEVSPTFYDASVTVIDEVDNLDGTTSYFLRYTVTIDPLPVQPESLATTFGALCTPQVGDPYHLAVIADGVYEEE